MCFSRICDSSADVKFRFVSHFGFCRCHTSVWPRTFISCRIANSAIWSACEESKEFLSGWITSHLSASSGSTMLNSRASVDEYAASESCSGLTAVPISSLNPRLCAASRNDHSLPLWANPTQMAAVARTKESACRIMCLPLPRQYPRGPSKRATELRSAGRTNASVPTWNHFA